MSESTTTTKALDQDGGNLPTIPVQDLTLVPATEAQMYEANKRIWSQWGNTMPLEDFMERISKLYPREIAIDGKAIIWVLTRREDPKTLDFFCSCITFKRAGFVVDAGSVNGREVVCYAAAAVSTPPQHRKKGYAKHMMRLLHWVLAPPDALPTFPTELWGERPKKEDWVGVEQPFEQHMGNAAFSVLYSGVGSEFYKQCGILPGEEGWVVQDPGASIWDVDILESTDGEGWEWLDMDGVNEMWKVDRELMKRDMEQSKPTKSICAFLPRKGLPEFEILKSYYWQKLGIKNWGVRKGNVFASWTLEARPGKRVTVSITRLRAEKDDFEELLRVMIGFAKRHGIKHFEIMGLKQELRELGFVKSEGIGNLPSIKSYSTEFEWRFNERFATC